MPKRYMFLTVLALVLIICISCLPTAAAAEDENGFTYELNEAKTEAELTGYTGTNTVLTVPDTLGGCPVLSIGANAFSGSSLTAITFGADLQRVEEYAFSSCSNLASVVFQGGAPKFGKNAFNYCPNLESITIKGRTVGALTVEEFEITDYQNGEVRVRCSGVVEGAQYRITVTGQSGLWAVGYDGLLVPVTDATGGEFSFRLRWNGVEMPLCESFLNVTVRSAERTWRGEKEKVEKRFEALVGEVYGSMPFIDYVYENDNCPLTNTRNTCFRVLNCDGLSIRLSESEDVFTGDAIRMWGQYNYIDYTLSEGEGWKTVFAELSDGGGNVTVVGPLSIYYSESEEDYTLSLPEDFEAVLYGDDATIAVECSSRFCFPELCFVYDSGYVGSGMAMTLVGQTESGKWRFEASFEDVCDIDSEYWYSFSCLEGISVTAWNWLCNERLGEAFVVPLTYGGIYPVGQPTLISRGFTEVEFSWNPPDTEMDIQKYNIYRDGVLVFSRYPNDYEGLCITDGSQWDPELPDPEPGQTYSYTVCAVFNYEDESAPSAPLVVKTASAQLDGTDVSGEYIYEEYYRGKKEGPPISCEVACDLEGFPPPLPIEGEPVTSDVRAEVRLLVRPKGDTEWGDWWGSIWLERNEESAKAGTGVYEADFWPIDYLDSEADLPQSFEYKYSCRVDYKGDECIFDSDVAEFTVKHDDIPPAMPDKPTLVSKSDSEVTLSWQNPSDNVEVDYCELYKDGELLAGQYSIECNYETDPYTYSFTDTDVDPDITSVYTLVAVDGNENRSQPSEGLTVCPPGLSVAEHTRFKSAYIIEEQERLEFSAATVKDDEDLYVQKLTLQYREAGTEEWSEIELDGDEPSFTGYINIPTEPCTLEMRFTVTSNNNVTRNTKTQTVVFKYDDVPPSKPGAPITYNLGCDRLYIEWAASEDNVTRYSDFTYLLYRDDDLIATLTGGETGWDFGKGWYQDTGLDMETEYTYYVVAEDERGNRSEAGEAAALKTGVLRITMTPLENSSYIFEEQEDKWLAICFDYESDYHSMYLFKDMGLQYKLESSDTWTSPESSYVNLSGSLCADLDISGDNDGYITPGEYEYRFRITDRFDVTKYSETKTVTLKHDDVPPALGDIAAPTGDSTQAHSISLSASASDNVVVASLGFYCKADGAESFTELKTQSGSEKTLSLSYAWDISGLGSGDYTLKTTAIDGRGNKKDELRSFKIDHTPPTVPGLAEADCTDQRIKLTWTISPETDLKTYRVYRSNTENGDFTLFSEPVTNSFEDALSVVTPEETDFWYKVTAVDIYDNESEPSDTIHGLIPVPDTEPPIASITVDAAYFLCSGTVTLDASYSTDNDRIKSYEWDFGDGSETFFGETVTHKYDDPGNYTATLTLRDRRGNESKQTIALAAVDPEASEEYGIVNVTVVNSATSALVPLINSILELSDDDGNSFRLVTDGNGKASSLLPVGRYAATVSKLGFITRSMYFTVVPGEQNRTIGISTQPMVKAELKAEEMTLQEIIDAGIDVQASDNSHFVKYEVRISFYVDYEIYTIPLETYYDNGNVLGTKFKSGSNGGEGGNGVGLPSNYSYVTTDPTTGTETVKSADEASINDTDKTFRVQCGENVVKIFPVSEHYYLIIYGEARWLKEMFNVELLVLNNSFTDRMENCTAVLDIPEGMSLAALNVGGQSRVQHEELIDCGSSHSFHWYVRGDEAGSYNLTASLAYTLQPIDGGDGQSFSSSYTTSSPIKVYAGEGLLLRVTIPDACYYKEKYTITVELVNTSDKPIYNLTNKITEIDQYQVTRYQWFDNGKVKEGDYWQPISSELLKGGAVFIPVLEAGEGLALELETTVFFYAALNSFLDQAGALKLACSAFSSVAPWLKPAERALYVMSNVDARFYLSDVSVSILEGSTTSIPFEIVLERVPHPTLMEKLGDMALDKLIKTGENHTVRFLLSSEGGELFSNVRALYKSTKKVISVTPVSETTTVTAKVVSYETAGKSSGGLGGMIDIKVVGKDPVTNPDGSVSFQGSAELELTGLSEGRASVEVDLGGDVKKTMIFEIREGSEPEFAGSAAVAMVSDGDDVVMSVDDLAAADSVELTVLSEEKTACSVLVVCYDAKGRMLDLSSVSALLEVGSNSISVPLNLPKGTDRVGFMLVDSTTQVPLTTAVKLERP